MSNINHNSTFSMQKILNQPLDPILCKRILEQIKSPLMQQSFILTNDQSFNLSYSKIPKRPNIPPLQKSIQYTKRPLIKNSEIKYGYSQDNQIINYNNLQQSIFQENKSSNFQKLNKQQLSSYMQAILSPLDPNINVRDSNNSNNQSLNFFQSLAKRFCGAVQNKQEDQQYIQPHLHQIFPKNDNRNYFQRKKIFDQTKQILKVKKNNNHSILFDQLKKNKSHIQLKEEQINKITIVQILNKLIINQHYQVKQFIQLCLFIIQQLYKVTQQIQFFQRNISLVFNCAVLQQNSIQGVNKNDNKYSQKALKRMNFKSFPNLLQKFIINDYMKTNNLDLKQVHRQKNKISESIQKVSQYFGAIEEKIDIFNKRIDKIDILKKVYQLLINRFTYMHTKSTYNQLINLFNDIYLNNHQQKIFSLQYIWPRFQTVILTQQQFINSVLRMNSIYSQNNGQFSQSKKHFQKQLGKLGYMKN